jgi:hypothetical protein
VTHFDRRKRSRLRLKLPVLLRRTESDAPLWTETGDISNNGFYCNTIHPFAPGDKLSCLIVLPTQPSGSHEDTEGLYLEARVDVVRIVARGNGFGVGCEIRQYRVVNNQVLASWAIMNGFEHKPSESVIEQLV